MREQRKPATLTVQHFHILVVNRGESFRCTPGQSLLASMERVNKCCINVGCRGGGCGICKVRILAGEYRCQRMSKVHVPACDAESGFALACRVTPLSDLVIESDHCSTLLNSNHPFNSDLPAKSDGNNPVNNQPQRILK